MSTVPGAAADALGEPERPPGVGHPMRPLLLLLAPACLSVQEPPADPEPVLPEYGVTLANLAARREALAVRFAEAAEDADRDRALSEARATLQAAIAEEIFPAWAGTRWAFSGVTPVPRQGAIACGHYVAAVLSDAGFQFDRKKLGRQASENIIRTFTPASDIHRFSGASADVVVEAVRREGPGIFLLGLDYHAAFLVSDGDTVQMCHSSNLGAGRVLCEDALTSPAFVSRYRVVGQLFDDNLVRAWLEERRLEVVGRHGT